jgi:hypothetical protein
MTTRTELIARLRNGYQGIQLGAEGMGWSFDTGTLNQAADMLESDGKAVQLALDALPPIFKAIKLLDEACSDLLMPGGTITTPTGLVITKPKEALK